MFAFLWNTACKYVGGVRGECGCDVVVADDGVPCGVARRPDPAAQGRQHRAAHSALRTHLRQRQTTVSRPTRPRRDRSRQGRPRFVTMISFYSALDTGTEYCDERVSVCEGVYVCVRVCVRVCLSAIISYLRKLHVRSSPIFCMLPMTVARSSSAGVAIRYIFPVLWMTSYLNVG